MTTTIQSGAGRTRGEAAVVSLSADKAGIRLALVVKPERGSPPRLLGCSSAGLRSVGAAFSTGCRAAPGRPPPVRHRLHAHMSRNRSEETSDKPRASVEIRTPAYYAPGFSVCGRGTAPAKADVPGVMLRAGAGAPSSCTAGKDGPAHGLEVTSSPWANCR